MVRVGNSAAELARRDAERMKEMADDVRGKLHADDAVNDFSKEPVPQVRITEAQDSAIAPGKDEGPCLSP